MSAPRTNRRLLVALLLLGIIWAAWSSRRIVVYEQSQEFCEITGSWRTRVTYVGRFHRARIDPSAFEAEAQRRGIVVQHDWQPVEWESRTIFGVGWHGLAPLLTTAADWTPQQLREMSDDQIRRHVSRPTVGSAQ